MANGQPKPAFYVAVFVVILGLVGLALYRYGAIGPRNQTGQISGDELKQMQKGAEAPDASGITTVKEYNYVPAAKLPEVKGISELHADGGPHGPVRDQRVGRLGPDHLRQQRLQGGQGLEDARRARTSRSSSC